jgi:hypothetical protein
MDTTFKELKCPHCGGETKQGNITVSVDVVTTKICVKCEKPIVLLIPNKNYEYSIDKKLINENSRNR